MLVSKYLAEEWKPALGCTEPASIAYATSCAAKQAGGNVKSVHLICDPRIYKNSYAVGIPQSEKKAGILWALAIGSLLPNPDAKLECFRQTTPEILKTAAELIEANAITVFVETSKTELFINCKVVSDTGEGRAIIKNEHTNLTTIYKNGQIIHDNDSLIFSEGKNYRCELAAMNFDQIIDLAKSIKEKDRELLRNGAAKNLEIANHGLTLFPKDFANLIDGNKLGKYSKLVAAGVYARMLGEDFIVWTLVGSGNKGITTSLPLFAWGKDNKIDPSIIEEACALTFMFTSAVTCYLGTLSAVCGASNASGLGLAAGLTFASGGGSKEISMAINNIVGNLAGMICDGAKIGCALKTMTAVDSAFRASTLALNGVGIPSSDGIIGKSGSDSLKNLGTIATLGMISMDREILKIMQQKLR